MANPKDTLRDAAQASVREVIGRKTVDEVLTSGKRPIQLEATRVLEDLLASYFGGSRERSPFRIDEVQIQLAQPPPPVQDAFNDVTRARQDQDRLVAEAVGDVREIRERATAQATELREAAEAFKQAKVADATGEAERFSALLVEYQRAPDVTRTRLYLETMEQVLPGAEKVIVQPDTVSLMPFLPASGGAPREAAAAVALPVAAAAARHSGRSESDGSNPTDGEEAR
jgi:membrane protease subunit HflK